MEGGIQWNSTGNKKRKITAKTPRAPRKTKKKSEKMEFPFFLASWRLGGVHFSEA
jgi:hypothetical protein